jgi:dienelactone hydrolase
MRVQKQELVYQADGTRLVGELVWDAAQTGTRPGILVFHEGGGINPHPKERAAWLAELGYVALACDMYGNGEFVTDPAKRTAVLGALRDDPSKLRARAQAGLNALIEQPSVDRARLAAIGFCFGGMVALELARSGAPLSAAVSFHGLLSTPQPAQPGVIKASVLALHGTDDPIVPPEQVNAFMAEMKAAGADWQLIAYGNAVHGFTRRDAATLGMGPAVAYDGKADSRSWQAMRALLSERFGSKN